MSAKENGADQRAQAMPAGEDFERFTRRLIGLARNQLDARLHHKIEPEDIVQSVYKSFFLRYGDAESQPQDVDGLWRLLTLITVRKCADRVRYHQAGRRNMAREAQAAADSSIDLWRDAIGREPTPDHAAVMTDTIQQILTGLSDVERPVIELSLQGYSTQEVSDKLGRAERSVRRVRERLKKQLEQLQLQEAM
jgi:RNA polymerase sigma-70 factor (ECF subfamily)